ncbi:DUF6789 family protein [Pseudonocardia nigra]|uniref:DUF6789 family protein n=1 Tax=Pseudonocardia nigra TaxID=1921578 RepID=UPI001C5FF5E8|nr:DUF6789 family protein [Pseudonocardia nigra]
MDAPLLYKPHPSLFPVALLGGFTGTVLLTALLRLAAALGAPVIDLPQLIGSVFSRDPATVFGAGHAVFVVLGVFVLPLALALLWPLTPGNRFTFRGALVKGALFGLVLFVLAGILLPLLGLLSTLPDVGFADPGPFALGLGLSGIAQLLLGTQLYSLTAALVAAMPRGLQPLDAIGWAWWSHGSGESP